MRLGFNQVAFRSLQSTPLGYSLKVTGFATISSAKTKEEDDSSAAFIDNLTFTRGRHTLKAGVEVRSERILPLVDRSGLQEVPVEITVAGGLRETVRLLYDLEQTSKILTVQDVKVRVVAVGQPRDLLTTFNVSGYLLPHTPPPSTGGAAPGAPKG